MPEINRINNFESSDIIHGVNSKELSSKISSEDSLSSLASSATSSKLIKNLEAEIYLINKNELTPIHIEQVVNQAESTVENVRRLFSLLVEQLSDKPAVEEQELNELVNLIPQNPKQLTQSLEAQHQDATLFCGKFFHVLNKILNEHSENELVKESMVQFLNNYDAYTNTKATIKSLTVNMEKLAKSTYLKSQSKPINDILDEFRKNFLIDKIDKSKLSSEFVTKILNALKSDIIPKLKEGLADNKSNSFARTFLMAIIQNTVKLENSSEDILFSSFDKFLHVLNKYEITTDEFKQKLTELLKETIKTNSREPKDKFMSKMLKIISNVTNEKIPNPSNVCAANVLNSLLANKSSTIPLLHFMLPLYNPLYSKDSLAFAQVWIDPNAQKKEKGSNSKTLYGKKIFCQINIELIGNFDLLLFVDDNNKIDCRLTCPKHVVEQFKMIKPQITQIIKENGFKVENLDVMSKSTDLKLNDIFPQINNGGYFINVEV